MTPGAVLDCGTTDLVIANGQGKLTVTGGSMTIRAHNLTVETTRSLQAVGNDTTKAGIIVELSGTFSSWGTLIARNFGGSSEIKITSDLDIVLQPRDDLGIDMVGSGQAVDGGDLILRAGRDIHLGSKIHVNGDDGTGSANQNSGGNVELTAGDSVYITQLIRGYGRWFHGGDLSIRAVDDVEIKHDGSSLKGEIDFGGKGADGEGGVVDIQAGDRVLISGPVNLGSGTDSNGGSAQGGELSIVAGCGGARLENAVDLRGGSAGGGNLSVTSRGPVTTAGSVDASARQGGGNGGDLTFRSQMGSLVFEGTTSLRSNGHVTNASGDGVGGTVAAFACSVDVAGGALIESTGQNKGRFEASSYKQGTALQNSFGIRVSEFADVSSYSTSGQILLRAATVTSGVCSNSGTTSCTLDSDCDAIGCTSGNCVGGNPQTDGQVVQFSSIPVVEQDAALGPCPAQCE